MKKSNKIIRVLCALVSGVVIVSSFVGCDDKNKQGGGSETKVIKYWCGISIGDGTTDIKDIPFVKALQRQTDVEIEFVVPSTNSSQKQEQFNLMVASNNLPDVIEWPWFSFSGGPETAIKNKVIIPINDLIEKNSPNLKAYLSKKEDVSKTMMTDKGQYFCYPFLRADERLTVFNGPMLRKDWLDELGLLVPETIDEWTNVLKQFKDKKGAAAPFSLQSNFFDTSGFLGAYGVRRDFYLSDDKQDVLFGQIQPGYKEFLKKMNEWYKEKLFDNNFTLVDANILSANMTNGTSGATLSAVGGGMGKWLGLMKSTDPNYDLVAAPFPVLEKESIPKFGNKSQIFNGNGVAITTACKNVEIVAKLLDYGYGEEGHTLYNFGIEGESFVLENGYPKYTDIVTNNSNGLSMSQALALYARAGGAGPFVQDYGYFEQYAGLSQQQNAVEVWKKTDTSKYDLPQISLTTDENKEYAKIMSDISTYVSEKFVAFINGNESLDNYDSYVLQIKNMGIDRAIAIQKQAYERYLNK